MMDFSTALKTLRSEVKALTGKSFSARALSELLKIDKEKYGKWEQGFKPADTLERKIFSELFQTKDLDQISDDSIAEAAKNIVKKLKAISKEIIPLGKHAPLRLTAEEYSDAFGDWEGLPVYNTEITASFIAKYQDEHTYEPVYRIKDPRFRDCDFAAVVTGDSMHPEVRHGDYVVCKLIEDKTFIVYGDIYYVSAKNGLETCKYVHGYFDTVVLKDKVEKIPDYTKILLVPRNDKVPPSPISLEMINRLYKVRGIIRGY